MRKRKIQTIKNKTMATLITLILMLTIAIPLCALPTTNAQDYKEKNTFAMCGVKPNPTGVGQEVLIWLGVTDMVRLQTDGFTGLTVTVTKPDGTTETLGPYRTDATGSTGATYTPNVVGNYTFQTHFPAQWFNWTRPANFDPELNGPIWYKASDSGIVNLVVQEEPVVYYPGIPLPTEYWVRPIDAQFREWSTISGNWLTTPPNNYVPYNDDAPESAHILWTKPLAAGGLVGGALGETGYEDGDAYEGKFQTSVIINGVLYYNQFTAAASGGLPGQGVYAVDLHTGEELWFRNNTRLAFGQTFYWQSFNYYGGFAYLWETSGSTWNAYDPLTGNWVYSIEDVPSGSQVYGSRGEIYIITIDLENGWMTQWNSSRTVNPQTRGDSWDGSWARNMARDGFNRIYPASRGMDWNKTIPTGLLGDVVATLDDRVIGSTASGGWTHIGNDPVTMWAFSLKPGQEGTLLFNKNWSRPQTDLTMTFGSASLEDGVFVMWAKETRQWYGFSIDTGMQLWGPTASEEDLGIYGMNAYIAYGKLYGLNVMGGSLYCYDVKTGNFLWKYEAKDSYNEILWSDKWPLIMQFITDGKIYLAQSEHSGNNPKPRGAPYICLNATTGEEVWKMSGGLRATDWGGPNVIGDSLIAAFNTYDNRIYSIGKGPSAATVTASDVGVPFGSSVTIRGTITDVSPGTEEYALRARFPNGVPAVSDANQSEWMQYVYMQFPRPMNAAGVPVTIDVIDSNGNYRNIGTATSDSQGMFTFAWKPDIEGAYTVIATFAGSKSYWPSSAETSFAVDPVAATPTPAPEQIQSMADAYILPGIAGIIVAVAVVGAVLALLVTKKRP
jgi:outer membrane protein assembly factor BamB